MPPVSTTSVLGLQVHNATPVLFTWKLGMTSGPPAGALDSLSHLPSLHSADFRGRNSLDMEMRNLNTLAQGVEDLRELSSSRSVWVNLGLEFQS